MSLSLPPCLGAFCADVADDSGRLFLAGRKESQLGAIEGHDFDPPLIDRPRRGRFAWHMRLMHKKGLRPKPW